MKQLLECILAITLYVFFQALLELLKARKAAQKKKMELNAEMNELMRYLYFGKTGYYVGKHTRLSSVQEKYVFIDFGGLGELEDQD